MSILYLIGGIMCIAICLILIGKAKKNYDILQTKHLAAIAQTYISICIEGILKPNSFFYMKNSGEDPCETLNDIKFINYFDNCNLFLERKNK